MAESFYHSFQLPLVIARPFNTYGPRQSARAVIPTIISQMASGVKSISLGDVRPTRDFTFVKDTCAGLVELMKCMEATGETVNIGTGTEVSIQDLFTAIKELMDSPAEISQEEERFRPEKSEVYRLVCDNNKMKKLTGFSPVHSLREGLEETIKWFTRPENLTAYKFDLYNL